MMRLHYRFATLFWYLLANFLLTLFIGSSYLGHGPESPSLIEWFYKHIAFISNFALLYLFIGSILAGTTFAIPSIQFLRVLSGSVLSIFNVVLLVDTIIFKLYRFHINSLVWNILMTEGSSDSVILGQSTLITFGISIAMIFFFEIAVHIMLAKWINIKYSLHKNIRRRLIYGFLFCLLINVIDKGIYAYADLTNKTYITQYDKLFPLYQPLTIKRLAKYTFGYDVDQEIEFKAGNSSGMLNYPLSELSFVEDGKKPNIVLIVIDSWRYDTMNPDVSPNIYSFAQNAMVFDNHYSGGNSTRFGIFSLFYGIYGTYWHSILSERKEPVLMKSIREMDYDIGIWSSTQLTFPEFRKTAFVGVIDHINDKLEGSEAKKRDAQQPELFDQWLGERNGENPFFAFLFLDAPHEPYSYPDNFTRYTPVVEEINYMDLNKDSDLIPFMNHYKNAVFFDDHITGQLINILQDRKLMDDTILIITGDHGAEFYERGFWGHNSSFSPEQVRVPFIMHIPGEEGKVYTHLTSHYDLVPTLFEQMGSTTSFDQYSIGKSILSNIEQQREFLLVSSWSESAIIGQKATLVFSTETHNMGIFEIRDAHYKLVANRQYTDAFKASSVAKVMSDMGRFIK